MMIFMTNRSLMLKDIQDDILFSPIEDESVINALATDGNLLYSVSSNGMLATWSLETLRQLQSLKVSKEIPLSIALNTTYIFVGSSSSEGSLGVWRKDDLSPVISIKDEFSSILGLAITEEEVLAARSSGLLDFYVLNDWMKTASLATKQAIATTLTVDDEYIFVGGIDDFVTVFKKESYSHVTNLEGHYADIFSLCSDEEYILSGSGEVWWGGPGSPRPPSFESAIRVWKKGTWECVKILEGHTDNVNALSADDRRIYSISDDGTLRSYEKGDWAQTVIPLSDRPLKSMVAFDDHLYVCDGRGRMMRITKSVFED